MKKVLGFILILTLQIQAVEVEKFIVETSKVTLPFMMLPGYGSGLTFKGRDSQGNLEFYGITDRGPNLNAPNTIKHQQEYSAKFFPLPNFTPNIAVIKVGNGEARVIDKQDLKINGKNISGRVIPSHQVGSTGEIGLSMDLQELQPDSNGLDTEGIAVDKEGNFWLCDEYGPFIIKADAKGNILKKYSPADFLPSILKHRIPNRGFEGISINAKGEIIAIMQSVLDLNNKKSKYIRIVKFNPINETSTMYAYPIDKGYQKNSDAKLGEIVFLKEDTFLVIEQGKKNKQMQNLIYKIDLKNASEIPNNDDLEYHRIKDLKPITKELVLDLRKIGWDKEKAEGLALFNNNKALAVMNDNDFNLKLEIKENSTSKLKDYSYWLDTKELKYKQSNSNATFEATYNPKESNELWIFYYQNPL